MAEQLDFSRQMSDITDWYPSNLFDPEYSNYAFVIMDGLKEWEDDLILSVWEKARLTVTVNDGTYQWIDYLVQMGKNIYNEHPQYVPNIIIMDEDKESMSPNTASIVEEFETLGSTVIYVPDQNSTEFVRLLQQVAHCARGLNMNLKEMFILYAEGRVDDDTMLRATKTLKLTDGIVSDIRIIMVTATYLTWLLPSGRHRIHVPETQFLPDLPFRSQCGIQVLDNCTQLCVTTCGLMEDCTNASAEDLEEVVTIDTDSPIQWYNGMLTIDEGVPDILIIPPYEEDSLDR